MLGLSRFLSKIQSTFPNFANSMGENQLNKKFDHELYSLKPNHRVFSQHPMVNDDLPNRIVCGAVKVKPNVLEFTETGVKFDDGTFEDDIDVVLLATGYIFGFPFLDSSVIEVKNNEVDLYKYAFPPDLEKQTLATIGFFQPIGAIMPICELQCRLATRVFKVIHYHFN
jgi:dimethylaniline monooxygenase (N-oxide forming)